MIHDESRSRLIKRLEKTIVVQMPHLTAIDAFMKATCPRCGAKPKRLCFTFDRNMKQVKLKDSHAERIKLGKPFQSEQKMYSYDGISWGADPIALRRRFEQDAAFQKHNSVIYNGKRMKWKKMKEKQHDAYLDPGKRAVPRPVILPVTHIGATMLGKAKGKKWLRYMRKPKDEPKVITANTKQRPVHKHQCHGRHHPMKKGDTLFNCRCEKATTRKYCGIKFCLYD